MLSLVSGIFAVDVYMPSMPSMQQHFLTSHTMMQGTISASVIGGSLVTPFLGPFSDSYGRRNILVCLQLLYSIAAFVSAFAPTIELLILARFIQGVGMSASGVLAFAIIIDKYEGRQVGIYFAYFSTAITSALIAAPLIGGMIAKYLSWPYCFIFISVVGFISSYMLAFHLPETLQKKHPFALRKIASNYMILLKDRSFMITALIPSFLIGGLVSFICNAPFYYITELGMKPSVFSIHLALVMTFNALASFAASRLIARIGEEQTIKIGLCIFVMGTLCALISTHILSDFPLAITFSVALFSAGTGAVFGAFVAKSMQMHTHQSGAVSAFLALTRGIIIAGFVSLSGYFYNHTLAPISIIMFFICGVVIFGYAVLMFSPKRSA